MAQNDNNARRVFVVADATDVTARRVYAVTPDRDARRVQSITPYDPTCRRVRIVAAGTPGAWPVYAVDAAGAPTTLA